MPKARPAGFNAAALAFLWTQLSTTRNRTAAVNDLCCRTARMDGNAKGQNTADPAQVARTPRL
jgi:hypothetical protein